MVALRRATAGNKVPLCHDPRRPELSGRRRQAATHRPLARLGRLVWRPSRYGRDADCVVAAVNHPGDNKELNAAVLAFFRKNLVGK